jgi:Flp pilus assembly protein TadB
MIKKLVSLVTVVALASCFLAASVYAKSGSDPKEPTAQPASAAEKNQRSEKLKADVTKLVADARAGKLKVPSQQFPQPQRNNLSKGATIAIVAGIGAAIVLIAILVKLNSD